MDVGKNMFGLLIVYNREPSAVLNGCSLCFVVQSGGRLPDLHSVAKILTFACRQTKPTPAAKPTTACWLRGHEEGQRLELDDSVFSPSRKLHWNAEARLPFYPC